MTRRPTILVLRALGLGDFLTGLPALALLRSARPDHRIVLAAPTHLAGLVRLAGTVDDLVPAHELDPIVGPPTRPELAIDLHGNGPESRRLLMPSRPERLLAFGYDDRGDGRGDGYGYGYDDGGGPRWGPAEHEVARWCRLLVEGLPAPGADVPGVVGTLPVPPDVSVPAGRTVVHVGAKARARRWPPERFAALARKLADSGHQVLVTGGRGESREVRHVASYAGVAGTSDITLEELCALVAAARLVVSGDTGVAHLASNYATPSVVLFGPVSPSVWGPPRDVRHQVLWHRSGAGDPHADSPHAGLLEITVDEVLEASERADEAAMGTTTSLRVVG